MNPIFIEAIFTFQLLVLVIDVISFFWQYVKNVVEKFHHEYILNDYKNPINSKE